MANNEQKAETSLPPGNAIPFCHRCGTPGPLADSHVIPAAFSRQIQGDSAILHLVGTEKDAFPRKLRKGLYVTDILCPTCDNWLNLKYEKQAIQTLIHGTGVTSVYYIREDIHLWRMDDVDLDRLKIFLLSVLWRAHITQMEPFLAFNLGSWAARIEQMVLTEDAGEPDEFPVIPSRFDFRPGILMPNPFEIEGVPFWEINLGDWHFLIKASNQKTPPPFDVCELRKDGPRLVIPRDFWESGHPSLMREMLLNNRDHRSHRKTEPAP